MPHLKLFGRFDVTHTCTSRTDTLWFSERIITDRNAIEDTVNELKAEFESECETNPELQKWTGVQVVREHDETGILYKQWDNISPTREECHGNDPKDWSSNGLLRIIRPVEIIREMRHEGRH